MVAIANMDHSPALETVGVELLSADAHGVVARLAFSERLTNRSHALHGGVIGFLLDTAMSFAARDGRMDFVALTVNLSINYLNAARTDLLCRAHVTRRGKRTVFVSADVNDARGEPVAQAVGSFNIYPRRCSE